MSVLHRTMIATGLALGIAFSVGIDSPAYAQDNQTQANQGMNVDVTVRKETDVALANQPRWIAEQLERAKTITRRVQKLLDVARREKDTLKITCLDDKLTQIRVNLRGIEKRVSSHQSAIDGGNAMIANQEFSIIKLYFSRIFGLMAEADNCVGDTELVFGETETTITVDDDITNDDPSDDDLDVDVDIDPTPHASGQS